MNLQNVKNSITLTMGRGGLILRKYSPEILTGAGIVGIVGSTIMACKATLKADEVVSAAKEKFDKIHSAKQMATEGMTTDYTEQDYKKDMTIAYVQTGVDFIKLYGPAVTLGMVSIACILGAQGIMRKRNLALVAAYKAVEEGFSEYRKRVVKELGREADRHFKYGTEYTAIEEEKVDENGNIIKSEPIVTLDPNGLSEYARIFDNTNINWSDAPDYNMTFLKCQQNYANDLLHARGHIFLNEVYDMLGLQRSPAGAVVGWVKGVGDDFVDFGMFDLTASGYRNDKTNDTIAEERRDFVNGYNKAVVLDFNVSGVIYDMI
jgi:hypothetical protein